MAAAALAALWAAPSADKAQAVADAVKTVRVMLGGNRQLRRCARWDRTADAWESTI